MVVLEQASLSQITVEYLTHTLVEIGRSDLKRTFEVSCFMLRRGNEEVWCFSSPLQPCVHGRGFCKVKYSR